MKKTVCILLVVIMAVTAVLCSCNDTGNASDSDVSVSANAYVPHLGETTKYAGKTLTILASGGDTADDLHAFAKEAIDPYELNDEPVNDAAWNRNQALKENYGFDIKTIWSAGWDTYLNKVRTDKASGIDDYDVFVTGLTTLGTLAAEGFFADLYSIEGSNLCLDKDWWDQAANEDMSIANKLYFATGDILMMDDENTRCVVYNMDILEENGLEKPADLVRAGEWTLEKFYTMAREAAVEDGDGVMTYDKGDVWGNVMAAFDTYTLVVGADCPMVEKDQDDIPQLAVMKDRNFNAFTAVYENVIQGSEYCTYTEAFVNWSDHSVVANFAKGQALFRVTTVDVVNSAEIRDSEVAYGILPVPKFDVEQEQYASATNPYWFQCIAIKENCKDFDFVTFALEAMAWSAKEYITPEYYERTLKNKRALQDDDAADMLDVLFSNRLVDISIVFNWDDCIQWYNNCLKSGGTGLTSYVESHQAAFEADMTETIDMFLED
ncbi:MAG: extracellular solute-binding protein [Clostridia bacterium]|nr:extracellular solute-binding protein [Clostridia bacterium]